MDSTFEGWWRCGFRLRSLSRLIALIDIIFFTIPVTLELLCIGYLLGIMDPFGYMQRDCQKLSTQVLGCYWNYQLYKEITQGTYSLQLNTVIVGFLVSGVLVGALLEGYLFSMLRRGVREEVHFWCMRWLHIRLVMLMGTTSGALWQLARGHLNLWVEGVLGGAWKVYRLSSLFVVWRYMVELEYTIGLTFHPPLRTPKLGSIGNDLHMLD